MINIQEVSQLVVIQKGVLIPQLPESVSESMSSDQSIASTLKMEDNNRNLRYYDEHSKYLIFYLLSL